MDDDLSKRALVGKMMTDAFEAEPPDTEEWARALEGCAELYRRAAQHLRTDPVSFQEAFRCVMPAVETGADIAQQVRLAYVLSGEATDDFMDVLRQQVDQMRRDERP